jgi:hypothetical protein
MSISFVCICGKHLRARDEMAGRRSMCPACGAPVGIPLLQPTHRGATLGPLSPSELARRNSNRLSPSAVTGKAFPATFVNTAASTPSTRGRERNTRALDITFDGPIEPALVHQVITRAPGKVPSSNNNWAQCLIYPIRATLPLCGLAVVLAAATGIPIFLMSEVQELRTSTAGALVAFGFYVLFPLAALGYACAALEGALASGSAGDTRFLYWPGRDLGFVLRSSIRWAVCFLAGPVVPIVGAFFYWMYCGDMEVWDWLILADLVTLAVGYGLFALLAVNANDRLLDANPVRVAEQVERLGYWSALVVLAASALVIGHGFWAFSILDQLRKAGMNGWLWLVPCWLSGLLLGTALFRLLGNWRQRKASE